MPQLRGGRRIIRRGTQIGRALGTGMTKAQIPERMRIAAKGLPRGRGHKAGFRY